VSTDKQGQSGHRPFARVANLAGTTGETLAYEIDLAGFTAFDTGREYVGNITITPQRATMTPVTYAVRVTKNLARITSVTPYLQPAGRAVRVILRGSGFDSVMNRVRRRDQLHPAARSGRASVPGSRPQGKSAAAIRGV